MHSTKKKISNWGDLFGFICFEETKLSEEVEDGVVAICCGALPAATSGSNKCSSPRKLSHESLKKQSNASSLRYLRNPTWANPDIRAALEILVYRFVLQWTRWLLRSPLCQSITLEILSQPARSDIDTNRNEQNFWSPVTRFTPAPYLHCEWSTSTSATVVKVDYCWHVTPPQLADWTTLSFVVPSVSGAMTLTKKSGHGFPVRFMATILM